jgi:hypothetical protein
MCLMDNVLSKFLDKFVLVFIDDILIYSNNREDNEEHLKVVLQFLKITNSMLNLVSVTFSRNKSIT